MLYAFFWVIPRGLNFICRRFETPCFIFIPIRKRKWNLSSVPKRRHINFRRRGIAQKKAHNSCTCFIPSSSSQLPVTHTESCAAAFCTLLLALNFKIKTKVWWRHSSYVFTTPDSTNSQPRHCRTQGLTARSGRLTPGKAPGIYSLRYWADARNGLHDLE